MFKSLILGLMLTTTAYAGTHYSEQDPNCDHKPAGKGQTVIATGGESSAESESNSSAKANSKSQADSSSTSSADSTNTNTATNAGNAQSTQVTTVSNVKNPVNTAIAGIGDTTAACRYHNGGGLQLFGVGLSLGHSSKDKDCERIALAQLMWSRGQDIAGDKIMCKVTTVHEALGDDCLALVHELTAIKVTETQTNYVTTQQLNQVEQRMTQKLVTK